MDELNLLKGTRRWQAENSISKLKNPNIMSKNSEKLFDLKENSDVHIFNLFYYLFSYLKSYRVNQCYKFGEGECKNIKPFVCFDWHFPNHRRRRSLLNQDGTFNYSSEEYCTKYNETTGICPDGDK